MALLDGVTVLDLASVGPGARASAWLADFGAAVVKVSPVPKHAASQIAPPEHAYSAGRGTRRIQLDLKADAGRAVLLRLAAAADVVIESFRPGVVTRLGIDFEAMTAVNPGIVYCSTTGYGQTGDRSQWAGHDINYLAMAGFLAGSGRGADGKPPVPGSSIADGAGGGMHAAMSILAALVARGSTGEGRYLDVSITDGMMSLMGLQLDAFLAAGSEPPPGSAPLHGDFACYDTYPTSDGGWVAVGAIEGVFWRNLCTLIGADDCIAGQWDLEQQQQIRDTLTSIFRTRSRSEWTDLLSAADTCVTPVLSVREIAAAERGELGGGRITAAVRHDGSHFDQLAPMLAGAERKASYDIPAPGETHTDAILLEAGFSDEELTALRADSVIA